MSDETFYTVNVEKGSFYYFCYSAPDMSQKTNISITLETNPTGSQQPVQFYYRLGSDCSLTGSEYSNKNFKSMTKITSLIGTSRYLNIQHMGAINCSGYGDSC
jgi:hypothetical protein